MDMNLRPLKIKAGDVFRQIVYILIEQGMQSERNIIQNCPAVPQSEEVKCRICLMEQGDFYKMPCRCTGSIGAIHNQCLEAIINRSVQGSSIYPYVQQSEGVYRIDCQLCKNPIRFGFTHTNHCKGCSQISREQKITIFGNFIIMLFFLGIQCLFIYLCVQTITNFDQEQMVLGIFSIVFTGAITLLIFIVLLCLGKRMLHMLIDKKITKLDFIPKLIKYS